MTRTQKLTHVLLAGLAGLLLGGCGDGGDGGTPSAEAVFAKAERKSLAATSVSVTGFVTQDGERQQLELTGRTDGSNARVVFSSPSQGRAEILTVDGRSFVKGDAAFDAAFYAANGSPDAPPEVVGRYVAAPTGQGGDVPTARGLLRQVFSGDVGSLADLSTKVEDVTFRGTDAYRATDRLGGGDGSAEILVAARTGLPLRLAATGDQAVRLVFSRWDAVDRFAAPPAEQVLSP